MPFVTYDGEWIFDGGGGGAVGYQAGVLDVVTLRGVTSHNNIDVIGVQLPLPGSLFMYDATSVVPDNGTSVIAPTDVGVGPGRWLLVTASVAATTFAGLTDTPGGAIPADVTVVSSGVGNALIYLKNNSSALVDPAVTDDSGAGYAIGSTWINTVGDTVWRCTDASAGAAVWKDVSASGTVTTETVEVPFAFNTASPLAIRSMVAGETVINAEIQIITTFDDGAAALDLGTVATPGLIIPAANNIPGTVGVYRNDVNFPFAAPANVRLTITPGTSTQGSGIVVMQIKL